MPYVRPCYDFTDTPKPFESMTMDEAADASAAALRGEVVAEDFIGNSVAGAMRYHTPIFSVCYVVRGFVQFRDYAYIPRTDGGGRPGGSRFAEHDAYRAEIAAEV